MRNTRKVIALLLALVMALSLVTMAQATPAGEYSGKLVILHSNDVHGNVEGYAYMAAVRDYFEDEGADVILADAGDFSQGTTYVSTTKGADAITMLNAVGYDVVTLGNHEFDYGWAQLKENMSSFTGTVLCANVFENGKTIFDDANTIIEKGGVKVGFFGMETPEAQTKVNPAMIKGLTFLTENKDKTMNMDMFDCAKAQVAALNEADVVICLSHLGVDNESVGHRSYELAAKVPGIDMIIDGHSHTVMTEGADGQAIQSTGTAFENVGVIVIDETSKEIEDNFLFNDELEDNEDVAAAAKIIVDRVNEEYGQVFASSAVALDGVKENVRSKETNMGDLITDSMVWCVKKDAGSIKVPADHIVAITNGGGIRASIGVGDITKKDVNTVLPFGNTVAVVYVTGSELLEALEASTYNTPETVGGFPQVAGIDFTIKAYKEYNAGDLYPGSTYYAPKTIERVTIDSINGKAFNAKDTYAVVTNNFCAAGGDTYYAFAAATEQFDTGFPMDEVLMDYISEALDGTVGQKYAAAAGRITVKESKEAKAAAATTGSVTAKTETVKGLKFYKYEEKDGVKSQVADSNFTSDAEYKVEKWTHSDDVDVNGVKTVYADCYTVGGKTYAVVSKDLATNKMVKGGTTFYLLEVKNVGDVKTDKVIDKKIEAKDEPSCGDYEKDVYMIDGTAYATSGRNWALLNGTFVQYGGEMFGPLDHQFSADSKKTYNKDGKVDSIKCDECKKVFSVVKASKIDKDWKEGVDFMVYDGMYVVLAGGKAAAETGKEITSAKTFDAGVVMYVGLSLASVAGTAVVIGKKKEF